MPLILKVIWLNSLGRKKIVAIEMFGYELKVRTATPDIYVAFETLGPEFEMLGDLTISETPLIVDAGGYIGTASLSLSALFPKAQIVCIEPSSENFSLLKQNTDRNPNIIAINAALVEDHGPEFVKLINADTGPWGFETKPSDVHTASSIPTVTFQKIFQMFHAEKIDVCKMDIEGGEAPLLYSPENWLPHVNTLIIELHERKQPGIEASFKRATTRRLNLKLPGEKVISLSSEFILQALKKG